MKGLCDINACKFANQRPIFMFSAETASARMRGFQMLVSF